MRILFHFSRNLSFIGVSCANLINKLQSNKLNGEILNKRPSIYLNNYSKQNADILKHLANHFIMEDAYKAALLDDYNNFISLRGMAIMEKIMEVCGIDDNSTQLIENTISDNEILEEESYDNDIDSNDTSVTVECH